MSILLTSDTHFTDHPIDEYRWKLFPFLKSTVRKLQIRYLIISGDICDAKDRHSAVLVNRLTENLVYLSKDVEQLILLRGNHDGLIPELPFFKFIEQIPNIQFITSPTMQTLGQDGLLCWFLPCTKTPEIDWKDLDFSNCDLIFTHMTFKGAIAENKQILDGPSDSLLQNTTAKIISGDVHVPQTMGRITYIGSPYPIHFADSFTPRLLLINDDLSFKDLHMPSIKRHTLTISNENDLAKLHKLQTGDQCKILIPSSVIDIQKLKQQINEVATEQKIEICKTEMVSDNPQKFIETKNTLKSTQPEEWFEEYVKAHDIDEDLVEVGNNILEEVVKCGDI